MDIHSFTKSVDFNIVHLDSVSSTNVMARELLQKGDTKEGLVLVAEHQTEGRGQQGSKWQSETGKNLLCSIILSPTFIAVHQQVYFNMAMCMAVSDVFLFHTDNVNVKWPNDVYINHKKAAGLLIENSISGNSLRHAIVGIGINVNQHQFDDEKATSLSLNTGTRHDKEALLQELIHCINSRYAQLKLKQFEKIKAEYHQRLLGWKQLRSFKANDEIFEATIIGVDEEGRLVLQRQNKIEKFMVKQISML